MDLTGTADGEPMRVGIAGLRHLHRRLFGGRHSRGAGAARKNRPGGYVDTALVDSTVGVLSNQALNYLVSGNMPKRIGNAHPNHRALSGVSGRRRPHHHRYRQRRSIRQAVRHAGRAGAGARTRPTRTTKAGSRIAPNWSANLSALTVALTARRTAAEARSGRRSRRPDQRSRAGVRRSAGGPPRHEARTAERRREGRQHPRRAHADRARRRPDGAPTARRRGSANTRAEILREIGEG